MASLLRSQNCLTMIDLHRDYLRCRGKSELAIWHGELLRGCKRSAIGVEVGHVTDSYWCPGRRWVYHASEGAAFAIDAVKATLTSISLPATALQPEDGTVLATMVRGCTALTSLDVGFNNLDERGVLELVRAARQRDQMVSLGFASCKIGTQGAKEIATYVATCAALASLNLEYNCIDPEGAMALADALSGDPTLTKLNLSEMNRSPEDRDDMGGILAISSALKTNRHLTYLNLSTNNIDVRAGTALAGAVAINGVLKHIDLTSNRLCGISSHAGRQVGRYDAAAVRALARTLETNLSLTSCDLRFNHIEDAEKQALRSACGSRVPDAFLKSLCLKM